MELNLPFLFCFSLYLRAIFQVQGAGAYIWRGDLTEGFLRYHFGGLMFGGAYTWRGLFSELYSNSCLAFFHFLIGMLIGSAFGGEFCMAQISLSLQHVLCKFLRSYQFKFLLFCFLTGRFLKFGCQVFKTQ